MSTETEKELPRIAEKYIVVGLLDGFKVDGKIYGYPIISLDKAISKGIELIVVVARPGSCKAISKRIGDTCRENNIALFDIRGKDLLQNKKVVYSFQSTAVYKYTDVIKEIERVDAVSFDIVADVQSIKKQGLKVFQIY